MVRTIFGNLWSTSVFSCFHFKINENEGVWGDTKLRGKIPDFSGPRTPRKKHDIKQPGQLDFVEWTSSRSCP